MGAAGGLDAVAEPSGPLSIGETIIMVPLNRWGFAGPPGAADATDAAGVNAVPQEEHFAASSVFWVPQFGQNIIVKPPKNLRRFASTEAMNSRQTTLPYYVTGPERHFETGRSDPCCGETEYSIAHNRRKLVIAVVDSGLFD